MINKFALSVTKFFKCFLGIIAYYIHSPHFLCVFLHKARGVKIPSTKNVLIGGNVLIDSVHPELIKIEESVFITRGVTILAHFNPTPYQKSWGMTKVTGEILLKKGCFIGSGAIILPHVTIGEGAVVGAGSVVTKNVDRFTVVAGNPARLIRKIPIKKIKHS